MKLKQRSAFFALLAAGSLSLSCGMVRAENSLGLGIGMLYNGLGVNVSTWTGKYLLSGSLGCMGLGYSSSSGDGTDDRDDGFSHNCGLGFSGVQKMTPSIGLALGLGVTNNEDKLDRDLNGIETHARLGMLYFFNNNPYAFGQGFNLGLGLQQTFRDESSDDTSMMLNIGYQF